MEGSSNSDLSCDVESVLVKSDFQPFNMDLPLSSDSDNISVASVNEGYESHLSSWDSEHETDIISLEENHLDIEQENQFVGVENIDENLSWEMDNGTYDELLKKFNEKEEELRVSNYKLQLSKQEIIKLKVQIENSEGELDNVRGKLKLKEEEVCKLKELSEEEIFKLKIQVAKSETELGNVREELNLKEEELQKKNAELNTRIPNYVYEIMNLVGQLEVAKEQLEISKDQLKEAQENLTKSECQVVSGRNEIKILEDMVTVYEDVKSNHELCVQKLNSMLDSQAKSSLEKDELINKWFHRMSEMKIQLIPKLEDYESRNSEIENKLRQYEDEKMKQEELNATQQMVLQKEISSLKEDLAQRKHDVEAANKEFDMLITERDEGNTKIDKILTEICSHDDQISDMKSYIQELKVRLKEVMVDYKTTLNKENELLLRVGELEKEVTRQNGVISDRAEEKREAIRQLCISLEYYRSRYLELFKAFVGHRRRGGHTVIAS